MNTIPLRRRSASVLIVTALATCAAMAERPNFLFVAFDDLVPLTREHIDKPGSFLHTLVPHRGARHAISARLTPNINRLAARGVTFTDSWTSYPLCNAARVALLTGISAVRSGYRVDKEYTFRDPRSRLQGETTLPQRLREAGYAASGVGKIFHFSESKHHKGVMSGISEKAGPPTSRRTVAPTRTSRRRRLPAPAC
jgi:arylsulfatase A-like enzyme